MSPKPQEWEAFYTKMRAHSGLDLNLYKANQLQRRIVTMAESKGHKDLASFWDWVAQDRKNVQWFMDKLAINVSELFRNPEKWREVEREIVPDLLDRSRTLKIWSAGCSYGAEAYTLAMVLAENFRGAHQIVGTDIDEAALTQAREGRFSSQDVKGVPNNYMKFLRQDGDSWYADAELRRTLSFKRGNLLADRFDRGFDLIMCRNVVIYFTDEAKTDLYKRFLEALKPGGYLFVGSTERIVGAEEMGYEQTKPFFYKKPLLGDNVWRNAS